MASIRPIFESYVKSLLTFDELKKANPSTVQKFSKHHVAYPEQAYRVFPGKELVYASYFDEDHAHLGNRFDALLWDGDVFLAEVGWRTIDGRRSLSDSDLDQIRKITSSNTKDGDDVEDL